MIKSRTSPAKPLGIDSFPFIFSYPKLAKDQYAKHMGNVIALASDPDIKLKYFYDHVNVCLLFLYNARLW
jgi:hypothetical protein